MDSGITSTFLVTLDDEHEIIIFQPAGTSSRILGLYDAKLNEILAVLALFLLLTSDLVCRANNLFD
jgi:hypothetical protein